MGCEKWVRKSIKGFFFGTILAVLSYEWLVSGLSKVLSGEFISGLYQEMMKSLPHMQYQFYAKILQSLHPAHAVILGVLIEAGEILAGLSFAFLAISTIRETVGTGMMKLGISTGILSAFMNLNFFFFGGGSIFLNTSEPFEEGVSIDFLMLLIQLSVSVYYYLMLRSGKEWNKNAESASCVHGS